MKKKKRIQKAKRKEEKAPRRSVFEKSNEKYCNDGYWCSICNTNNDMCSCSGVNPGYIEEDWSDNGCRPY